MKNFLRHFFPKKDLTLHDITKRATSENPNMFIIFLKYLSNIFRKLTINQVFGIFYFLSIVAICLFVWMLYCKFNNLHNALEKLDAENSRVENLVLKTNLDLDKTFTEKTLEIFKTREINKAETDKLIDEVYKEKPTAEEIPKVDDSKINYFKSNYERELHIINSRNKTAYKIHKHVEHSEKPNKVSTELAEISLKTNKLLVINHMSDNLDKEIQNLPDLGKV